MRKPWPPLTSSMAISLIANPIGSPCLRLSGRRGRAMGATSSVTHLRFAGWAKGSELSASMNLQKCSSTLQAAGFLSNAESSGIQNFPRPRSLFGPPAWMGVGMTFCLDLRPTSMMEPSLWVPTFRRSGGLSLRGGLRSADLSKIRFTSELVSNSFESPCLSIPGGSRRLPNWSVSRSNGSNRRGQYQRAEPFELVRQRGGLLVFWSRRSCVRNP